MPSVWLIDVPARAVHLHERPAGDACEQHRLLRSGGTLPVCVDGLARVAVSDLFAVLDRLK